MANSTNDIILASAQSREQQVQQLVSTEQQLKLQQSYTSNNKTLPYNVAIEQIIKHKFLFYTTLIITTRKITNFNNVQIIIENRIQE